MACRPLPSESAACSAVTRGTLTDWANVGVTMALRGALVAGALYLYDPRDKKIIPRAFAAVAAIELFVVAWAKFAPEERAP